MSNSHKGSHLILKGQVIAVDFATTFFDMYRDQTGIQYGNLIVPSGTVVATNRPYEGKYGGGVAVGESTTNLLTNPSFESSTAGYSGTGAISGSTWGTTSAFAYDGSNALYITRATGSPSDIQVSQMVSFATGNQLTGSIYVQGTFSGNVRLQYYDVSGNYLNQSDTVNFNGYYPIWTRLSITGRDPSLYPSGTAQAQLILDQYATGTVYSDAWQLEYKKFATSYVSGSRGNGQLSYGDIAQYIPTNAFTVSMWVKPFDLGLSQSYNMAFSVSPAFYFGFENTTLIASVVDANNTQRTVQYNTTCTVGNYYMISLVFNAGTISIYLNGAKVASQTITPTIMYNETGDTARSLYIGNYYGSPTYQFNGIIDDVRIDPVAKTDEDIMSWYVSQVPFFNPYDKRAYAL